MNIFSFLNKNSKDSKSDLDITEKVLGALQHPAVIINSNYDIIASNSAFGNFFLLEKKIAPDKQNNLNSILEGEIFDSVSKEISNNKNISQESRFIKPIEICYNRGRKSHNIHIFISQLNIETDNNKPEILLYFHDITAERSLEADLNHSQKMQIIGQMAGGIAHDFNNLLTAIIGFCDLLLKRHPIGDPSHADLMQIKQNSNRASDLVRQILAFSRKQTLQPQLIDITETISDLTHMIRRLIGTKISLDISHGRHLDNIYIDKAQFEQIITNLVVNAYDAMDGGGNLSITTENCIINSQDDINASWQKPEQAPDIIPGEYVMLKISDTGSGINPELINKIFEPFFSTKITTTNEDPNRGAQSGSGLGLATVFGIIVQSGGYIYLFSKPNEGTDFIIFFPKAEQQPQENDNIIKNQTTDTTKSLRDNSKIQDLTGNANIFLIDDEDPIRMFAARALENKGYKVLQASSGEDALKVIANYQDKPIDLIISDVMMPGMNGVELIHQIKNNHQNIVAQNFRVIFMSGYTEDVFESENNNISVDNKLENYGFLQKPFDLKKLVEKVKEELLASES